MRATRPVEGGTGIAHTRWATHGAPAVITRTRTSPHGSSADAERPGRIAIVHNGIIENHDELRAMLEARLPLASQTDSEVIAHLIDDCYDGDLQAAVQQRQPAPAGAYAIAAFCRDEPHARRRRARSAAARRRAGSDGANHLASDAMALAGVTGPDRLPREGDVADLQLGKYWVTTAAPNRAPGSRPCSARCARCTRQRRRRAGALPPLHAEGDFRAAARSPTRSRASPASRPSCSATARTASSGRGRLGADPACGTSSYAGRTAKLWLEGIARIPTTVEVASEYRYRDSVPNPRTLVVTISQSGETADTLSALRHARAHSAWHNLTICNVATSAMVRECELAYVTRAGVEIGVASTKAFTTSSPPCSCSRSPWPRCAGA